ncbi:MAG: metallophosphoesterase family protein [Candidatus Omnitrophica bacterium]|nr:metallophosphoesterase family protein [Candidatus Omnitrophota bacterium]
MKILVISDTHMPRSAQDLPEAIYKEIENVDMIVHAGDFVEKDLFDKLSALRKLKAVCGNMDSAELRHVLQEKEVFEVEGFSIGLIHGYGAPANMIETVKGEFKGVDAIIFGHSHAPTNITKDGVLFLNPGSPTDKVFARENTYAILEITEKKMEAKIVRI